MKSKNIYLLSGKKSKLHLQMAVKFARIEKNTSGENAFFKKQRKFHGVEQFATFS